MEQPSNSQPRDSRLARFSAAASNIISVERGLTSTALNKIHYLATEQHLSENQVIDCLDRLGDGGSELGRVGRYEQLFLDRMTNDLLKTSGTVLSPTTAQEALVLAKEEYQIGVSRAQQLLDHVAQERGLQQISTSDAQHRIRLLISQRLESSKLQRKDFEDELVAHAANFGISAEKVSALLDTEIETRHQLNNRRKVRLIAVVTSALLALCVVVASCWLWLNTPTPTIADQTTTQPIVDSNPIEVSDAETGTIAEATDGLPNRVQEPAVELSSGASEALGFEIDNVLSLENTVPVSRFEEWQQRCAELVGQDFEQSQPDTTTPLLADLQKKKDALAALVSERSDERIQTRALDDLSVVAQRIDDITPEEAKSIAAFCFGKHGVSTEPSVVRAVKQFGRWPRFLLAVSDAFASEGQKESIDDWHQRIAFAITDGKLKNNNFSASFFAMARLRVQERLIAIKRTREAERRKIENAFVSHLRQFVASEMNNRALQSYFNQLIDTRSLDLPSMQRQIELQQILIEALLFAKSDDESLAVGEKHFRSLNSAATMGDQLAQSREAVSKLVALHLEWLRRTGSVAGASSHRESRWLEAPATDQARRLRDEAEDIVISGDNKQLSNAVEKYRSAIACGDRAITLSCLRGLMAVASNPTDRNGYQRQFDFVNGGQLGPYLERESEGQQERLSKSDIRAIAQKCLQLRQTSIPEATPISTMENKNEILAALNWLSHRRSPWSMLDLDLLLQIEAEATRATGPRQTAFSSIQLPWSIQATLPPVEVTPLVPLRR